MAWLYKRAGSEHWWIGARVNGRQVLRSTGEREEGKAKEKLAVLQSLQAAQRANRLSRDLFEALTGAQVESVTLHAALDTWAGEITNPATRRNYEGFAKQMKAALPHDPPLADVTHEDVRGMLAQMRAAKRASTVNLALRCAKAFFSRFKGSIHRDPTDSIPAFRGDEDDVRREAFTPEQIRQMIAVASPFWRYAAAVAFYSGLRLSNVATLKVRQVNLATGQLEVARTKKTGARVCVKLPGTVIEMIRKALPPEATEADYIWPDQAALAQNGVSCLSGQFSSLLVKAGIREEQEGGRAGTATKRKVNALTFHSLRHAFVSALANAGVNQQTVKRLVGHSSDRVNDAYTHIGQLALDRAAALLPDVTEEGGK